MQPLSEYPQFEFGIVVAEVAAVGCDSERLDDAADGEAHAAIGGPAFLDGWVVGDAVEQGGASLCGVFANRRRRGDDFKVGGGGFGG